MRRVGIAVEQLDDVFGALHERFVHRLAGDHGSHGDAAVGEALGECHQVRSNAELLGGERRAGTPEAGDDFVEYQQDAVAVADLADALQVALRRNQHAG